MSKKRYKKTDENNNIEYFSSLKEAAKSIDTKLDDWKVAIYIAEAIIHKHKAYKCKWEQIG